MKTRWILAVISSLWACLVSAQDSTTRYRPQLKFGVFAGGSYECWQRVRNNEYDKQVWDNPNMRSRFRIQQGWNVGTQLTAQYRKGFLSRAKLTFQHTANRVTLSFKHPQSELNYFNKQYRVNLTLFPLGYSKKIKDCSVSAAVGIGIYSLISERGSYGRWDPGIIAYEKSNDWHRPNTIQPYYTTQIQIDYKHWSLGVDMNWLMTFPINDIPAYWLPVNGISCNYPYYFSYTYHTLDISIGYQF